MTLRFNDEGWLEAGEVEIAGKAVAITLDETSNRRGRLDTSRGVGIIEHYTAHRSAHGAQDWLDDRRARASAHFVVGDRDEPVIFQTVSLLERAWHAGDGRWDGRNPNDFCWGIEHSCAGLLTRRGAGWVTWYKHPVPDAEVVRGEDHLGRDQAWDDYDPECIAMSLALHRALAAWVERRGLVFLDCRPHSFVAPHRKYDTGPHFPMAAMRAVMGDRRSAPTEEPVLHEIAAGDTFWGIARAYGVDPAALIRANRDVAPDPSDVPIGTRIRIPS